MNRYTNLDSFKDIDKPQLGMRPIASRFDKNKNYNQNRIFDERKEIAMPINFQDKKEIPSNLNNHFQYLINTPQKQNDIFNHQFFDFKPQFTR